MKEKPSNVMTVEQRERYERVSRDVEMELARDSAKKWKNERRSVIEKYIGFDWGCPAWQDVNAYPSKPNELASWQWRWEFLRRRPQYRIIFLNLRGAAFAQDLIKINFDIECFIDPKLSAPELSNNPFAMLSGGESFRLPDRHYFETDFFCERNIELDDDAGKLTTLLDYFESLNLFESDEGADDEFFRLQHHKPIRPQKKLINKRLDSLQESRTKLKKHLRSEDKNDPFSFHNALPQGLRLAGKDQENWVRHIRIIDAKDQGATHAEIAKQFVEDEIVDEATVYKFTENKETNKSRHKALVSQWYDQAIRVMEKASHFL